MDSSILYHNFRSSRADILFNLLMHIGFRTIILGLKLRWHGEYLRYYFFLLIFPGQQFKERIILLFQLQRNIFWVAKNNKIGVMGLKPWKSVYEVAILLVFTFIHWLDQIVQGKSIGDAFTWHLFLEIKKIWLLDDLKKM